MNTTVDALKALYVALGGEETDVAECVTNVDVLNVISAKYEGADDAILNPEAIENIAVVAGNIGGGDFSTVMVTLDASKYHTQVSISIPVISETENVSGGYMAVYAGNNFKITSPVILYKGKAFAFFTSSVGGQISTSGDITYENNAFTITGDGTITIS